MRWQAIQRFPARNGYEVSDTGVIRSRLRPRGMKPQIDWLGRPTVMLYGGDSPKRICIHRLVLEAFVGPAPEGTEGCHNDGDPTNNRVENLRWDTHSSNILDTVRHGTHPNAVKTHCPADHPYDRINTYVNAKGDRICRRCAADRMARTRQARRLLDERIAA